MTEKESLEEIKQPPQEQEETESEVIEEVSEPEESAFLSQWKERHQAYLANQLDGEAEEAAQPSVGKEEQLPVSKPKQAAKASSKRKKQRDTNFHIATSQSKKARKPISREEMFKSFPVFMLAIAGIVFASYFISPWSKEKQLEVRGTQHLTVEEVLAYSQISDRDYALTTLLSRGKIEENIQKSSNLVKANTIAFQFPNRFIIDIEEYKEVGYLKEDNHYRLVLSSGNVSEKPIAAEDLSETAPLIHLKDQGLIKELALQLATIDQAIVTSIQTIDLTPSKSTADLLTLSMYDGHKVLVPLSEIKRKLPYYSKIAEQLSVPSTIDMEVGIFSYAS